MQVIGGSLDDIQGFFAYLAVVALLTVLYAMIYLWLTPHREIALIRQNNTAAALAFGGSLVGFSLPLSSAVAQSAALIDCIVWGLIAIVVQIAVYFAVRLTIPGLSERIERGETASGIWLGAASFTGGLLNAACMVS